MTRTSIPASALSCFLNCFWQHNSFMIYYTVATAPAPKSIHSHDWHASCLGLRQFDWIVIIYPLRKGLLCWVSAIERLLFHHSCVFWVWGYLFNSIFYNINTTPIPMKLVHCIKPKLKWNEMICRSHKPLFFTVEHWTHQTLSDTFLH